MSEKQTYTVIKKLELSVEIEASTPQEAIDKMLELNDNTFVVEECDYHVEDADGNEIDTDAGTSMPAKAERTYSSAPRRIEVENAHGQTVTWNINPGLTDRWGEVIDNLHGPEAAALRERPDLRASLVDQMVEEMSFIAIKDGLYGVLLESEFAVIGDGIVEDEGQLLERDAVMAALRLQAQALSAAHPGVDFALIPESEAVQGRPGLWAWCKAGALPAAERAALGAAMLEIDRYIEDAPRPAGP